MYLLPEVHLGPCQIFKMGFSKLVVNSLRLLTIFLNNSLLGVIPSGSRSKYSSTKQKSWFNLNKVLSYLKVFRKHPCEFILGDADFN